MLKVVDAIEQALVTRGMVFAHYPMPAGDDDDEDKDEGEQPVIIRAVGHTPDWLYKALAFVMEGLSVGACARVAVIALALPTRNASDNCMTVVVLSLVVSSAAQPGAPVHGYHQCRHSAALSGWRPGHAQCALCHPRCRHAGVACA